MLLSYRFQRVMTRVLVIFSGAILLSGCTAKPDNVEPVKDFDGQRYLGTWYEIARLDHAFERGLNNVSAQYIERDDGGIDVINKGFKSQSLSWSQANGKAYFVSGDGVGHLKVSFFGPFYSSYIVFELDENYQYAFVAGYNHDYLWLLSRTPTVKPWVVEHFKTLAKQKGFNVADLILVDQSKNANKSQDIELN